MKFEIVFSKGKEEKKVNYETNNDELRESDINMALWWFQRSQELHHNDTTTWKFKSYKALEPMKITKDSSNVYE